MRNGRVGVAEDEQTPSDAFEWYVSNASDQELDQRVVLRWEGWCDGPGHLAEYAEVIELRRLLRTMPPPVRVAREVLWNDARGESEVKLRPPESRR